MSGAKHLRASAILIGALIAPSGARGETEAEVEARTLAALRGAASAAARGDTADAAARFDRIAAASAFRGPARLLAAQQWHASRQPVAAEASARSALEGGVGAPWEADLFDALGTARAAQGDSGGAHRAWREALARGIAAERAAEIRLALAEGLAASDRDAAARELRVVWIEAAGTPASERAGQRLDELERREGRALRGGDDWVVRADRLFAAQRTEAALAAYDEAIAAGVSGGHASRRRADCLFRARRYQDAAEAFGALGSDPDARVWRARSLARADRVDAALAALAAVASEAPRATAAWARFLAALLHEGRGRSEQARALFEAAAADGEPKVATDALWRLGFSAYRAGDLERARRHLDALARRQTDPVERLAARYWSARAGVIAAAEDPAPRAELAAIAREYPFSYYGIRARALAAAEPTLAASDATSPESDDSLGGEPKLPAQDLAVARILAEAGLAAVAERAAGALEAAATSAADRVAVARLYTRTGQPHRAVGLLVRSDAERFARGPLPGRREIWRLAWPDAFAGERRAALSRDTQLPPWLVAALMREESGFRPDAVSVTGALGLLQLMPDTARQVASTAGIPVFPPDRLLEPAFNIRLGTLLLEGLAGRHAGAVEPIAAAYNAGAATVDGWRKTAPIDEAEWVETIPYDETRGYVKRGLRSLHAYQELYR